MPDIFKTPWYYINLEDTVQIPDVSPEAGREENGEEWGADTAGGVLPEGEGPDGDEGGNPNKDRRVSVRRNDDRRKTDRRADDDGSPDSVIRRYKERLALTKEEFFEEIGPELMEVLRRQMLEIRSEAYRDELIRQGGQIAGMLEEVDRRSRALEQTHGAFMKEFTEELKYMALDIAERILHKEIEDDRFALEAMALQMVSEVKNTSWINVEVSDQVEGLAEHLRTQLQKAEQGNQVFVERKDAPQDTCRIVTEEGIIDATLSVQLKQLREAFMKAEEEGD